MTIKDFLAVSIEPVITIKYDFVCDFELEKVTGANKEDVIKSGGDIPIKSIEIIDDCIFLTTEPITAAD